MALEAEEYAEYKSEYYHGEIFAMPGASFHHNVIAGNVISELHSLLRNSDCFVFGSDMKVQILPPNAFWEAPYHPFNE